MKNARFRYQANVESIYFDAQKGRNQNLLIRLACCNFIRNGQSVLITGQSGTDKSYIASALGETA